MKRRIKVFYLMPGVWKTVTHSQVFNWVKLFNDSNYSTDCLSFSSTSISEKRQEEIEAVIGGKFISKKLRPLFLNDIYVIWVLIKLYVLNFKKYDKIVIQSRLTNVGLAFMVMNKLPKLSLIFESRGATIEERSNKLLNKKITYKEQIKFYHQYYNIKLMVKYSNEMFCVSNALKDYYLRKIKGIRPSKITVVPGGADAYLFFYSKELRIQFRKKLGYSESDIVLVYSGALDQRWEIPDKMFNYLSLLRQGNSNMKFLIITPDLKIAQSFVLKHQIKECSKIQKLELKEVNNYLNACDISILLREDEILNNVASPTKFAEYLLAGLPVVISRGIYDFVEIVNQTGFGKIINDMSKVNRNDIEEMEKLIQLDRKTISEWSKRSLSKEVLLDKYLKVLNS